VRRRGHIPLNRHGGEAGAAAKPLGCRGIARFLLDLMPGPEPAQIAGFRLPGRGRADRGGGGLKSALPGRSMESHPFPPALLNAHETSAPGQGTRHTPCKPGALTGRRMRVRRTSAGSGDPAYIR